MKVKFYICEHCGNIITMVKDSGVPVVCCGQKMKELVPGTVDASFEKHIPVFDLKDHTVSVRIGSVEHPMTEEHHIEWVAVQTQNGVQRKEFQAGEKPEMDFALCDGEEVEAVFAYCNLHGLWKA